MSLRSVYTVYISLFACKRVMSFKYDEYPVVYISACKLLTGTITYIELVSINIIP